MIYNGEIGGGISAKEWKVCPLSLKEKVEASIHSDERDGQGWGQRRMCKRDGELGMEDTREMERK